MDNILFNNQTVRSARGTGTLQWNRTFTNSFNKNMNRAQMYVDSEVLRRNKPFTPFLSGVLQRSGDISTKIGSGNVQYKTPYARFQYYNGKANGQRGRLWFERMKTGNKASILKGAQSIMRG